MLPFSKSSKSSISFVSLFKEMTRLFRTFPDIVDTDIEDDRCILDLYIVLESVHRGTKNQSDCWRLRRFHLEWSRLLNVRSVHAAGR